MRDRIRLMISSRPSHHPLQDRGRTIFSRAVLAFIAVSITAGCSEEKNAPLQPQAECLSWDDRVIRDIDFVRSQFFFFGNPDGLEPRIDLSTVQVWLDDRDHNNDVSMGARTGHVTITGAAEDSTKWAGWFHRLDLNTDFTLQRDLMFGHTILALRRPLQESEVLGVGYVDTLDTGTVETIGVVNDEQFVLKALKPPDEILNGTDLRQGPWATTRKLALRNVYDLGLEDIDIDWLTIRIHRDQGASDPTTLGAVPFIQVLGLDRLKQTGAGFFLGHDGEVDWDRVSPNSGYLVLPDLRPFAPDEADIARMGTAAQIEADRGVLLLGEDQFPQLYDYPSIRVNAFDTPSQFYFTITYCAAHTKR